MKEDKVSTEPINLALTISSIEDTDRTTLDRLTRGLLAEVRQLDLVSAELVHDEELPAGAKVGDPIALGALALAVLPTVLPALIGFIQTWVMRGRGTPVRIKTDSVEIEFTPDRRLSFDEIHDLARALQAEQ